MNIPELKKAKFELEKRLLNEMRDSIKKFELESGVRVSAVTLHTTETRMVGGDTLFAVNDLAVSIEF
jgi:hypothetical protein